MQSEEKGKIGKESCFSTLYFVPWYLEKNTASFCFFVCQCCEAGRRRRKECKWKSREEKYRCRITLNWLQFQFIFKTVKRAGTCRNDPSKILFEPSFNPFPLSRWNILILNQMNGELGSKQSLPTSRGLSKLKGPWQMCFFSICLQLPNPKLSAF